MSDDPHDQLDPALRRARYGRGGDGDRFVGLWLSIMVAARQLKLTPSLAGVRRTLDSFFRSRDLRAALDAVGEAPVVDQLRDAATVYFQTFLTDPNYSSVVWGMNRLQPDQLRAKAAKDAAQMLVALVGSRAGGLSASLPAVLIEGFVEVFGEPGREALRAAAATRLSLSGLTI